MPPSKLVARALPPTLRSADPLTFSTGRGVLPLGLSCRYIGYNARDLSGGSHERAVFDETLWPRV